MPVTGRNGEVVEAVDGLPPLPVTAERIRALARDPRAPVSDFAMAMSLDPGLTARVLQVTNRPPFRRVRDVMSVQEGLAVLGYEKAKRIAAGAVVAHTFEPVAGGAFRVDGAWRYGVAVAMKASELAGRSRRIDVPSAFTAGILHGLGRLAMYAADPAVVDEATSLAANYRMSIEEAERACGYDSAVIGAGLARKWGLPGELAESIGGAEGTLVAGIVTQAERFCRDHGLLPGYATPPENSESAGPARDEFRRLMRQVSTLTSAFASSPSETVDAAA